MQLLLYLVLHSCKMQIAVAESNVRAPAKRNCIVRHAAYGCSLVAAGELHDFNAKVKCNYNSNKNNKATMPANYATKQQENACE